MDNEDTQENNSYKSITSRYNELFYKAKEIVRIGSIDNKWYTAINAEFENILQRLTSETSSRETIEQPTTTPKGRP